MSKYTERKIKIPSYLDEDERDALALEIIDKIIERTQKGKDKNGNSFPSYSKEYKESLDFKIAGKSSRVTLELSGDMLADMELIKSKKGELVIGYSSSNPSEGKAEGNIRGTYGQSSGNRSKARNFLGIEKEDLDKILSKYKDEDKRKKHVAIVQKLIQDAEEITGALVMEDLDED